MKKLLFYLTFICSVFGSDINLQIENINNFKGKLFIGLYDKSEDFQTVDRVFKGFIIDIKTKTLQYKIENLSDGKYAIALFCDENKNGKLDKNFFGVPLESYGFSNNPKVLFKSPTFEDASFLLNNEINLTIKVK